MQKMKCEWPPSLKFRRWQIRNLSRQKAKRMLSTCKQSVFSTVHCARGDVRLKLIELPSEGERPSAVNIDTLFSKHNSKDLIRILHRDRKVQSQSGTSLSHEADGRQIVEAFHPGAGRKFALAVSVATAVQCVQCDTLFSAPTLRNSNKRCNNFVVEDSVAEHRKQRDKKLNWAVHVVCRCVWRMRLFCTPLDKPEKNGEAKIQARSPLTPLGTRRQSENSGWSVGMK